MTTQARRGCLVSAYSWVIGCLGRWEMAFWLPAQLGAPSQKKDPGGALILVNAMGWEMGHHGTCGALLRVLYTAVRSANVYMMSKLNQTWRDSTQHRLAMNKLGFNCIATFLGESTIELNTFYFWAGISIPLWNRFPVCHSLILFTWSSAILKFGLLLTAYLEQANY